MKKPPNDYPRFYKWLAHFFFPQAREEIETHKRMQDEEIDKLMRLNRQVIALEAEARVKSRSYSSK